MKQFVFLLSSLLLSSAIYACSCAPAGKLDDKQFEYYDFIARGSIQKVEEVGDERQFLLKVTDLYKGPVAQEVVITTPLNSAACGLYVNKGDTWLIYATENEGALNTGLCTRSIPLKSEGMNGVPDRAKEDLKFLEKKISAANGPKVYSIGVIDHVYSDQLGEDRILNIYLPEGYEENDTAAYPVIYLLDGSADEDFEHVAGLLQFCTFSWLNYMPKSIIVGIANTDRKRDFTFPTSIEADQVEFPTTGGSADFIRFLESELQPYIQSHYRANGTKMLIGQSLGGLLATEILVKNPQLFHHYFIISPSLWWDEGSLLKGDGVFNALNRLEDISVFVAAGSEGQMTSDARSLMNQLESCKSIRSQFEYFSDEDHGSILHSALYRGFKDFRKLNGSALAGE